MNVTGSRPASHWRYPAPNQPAWDAPNSHETTLSNRPESESTSQSDIDWLESVLFERPGELISVPPTRSSPATHASWIGLPLRGATRRLIPTAGPFAAEAFANDHDAMSDRRRALGRAARSVVRTGALRFAPQFRSDIGTVFGDPNRSVIAAATSGLGETVAGCAITLGPRRYNRKPVVQLMSHDATTFGFLKVGADAMTSAMVATEASAIEMLGQTIDPVLEVPRVLWRSEWQGRAVACFSPVGRHATTFVPASPSRLIAVANAVIEAGGGRSDVEVGGCAPVTRLRIEANAAAKPQVAELVKLAVDVYGDQVVSVGAWHGDFSAWNMISSETSTALIDWEFASREMPVGSDLLHHDVMGATHLQGEPANEPIQRLVGARDNIAALHAMKIPARQHQLHVLLYLLELIRRDLELERVGRTPTGFGGPALEAVAAIVAGASLL